MENPSLVTAVNFRRLESPRCRNLVIIIVEN
jgi:hypothetical protein